MINDKVLEALNGILNFELDVSRNYLAAAGWCHKQNLPGFAGWCLAHSKSHEATAFRYFDYIYERGGDVNIGSFGDQNAEFSSVLELVESAMDKEKGLASAATALYEVAQSENDRPVIVTLSNFVILSQVAKEKALNQLIDNIKLVGSSGQALIMLDRSLTAK